MGFSTIIGHGRQLETLRVALMNKRLHHAYLFTGPEGVGKRTSALALAMAIHCTEKSGDFCGHCAECGRIKSQNHPDVRMIGPLESRKEITIQQIRELEKELRYRSFAGGHKIAIIDSATSLNIAAQNALLKTLEEPPKDSLLILVAANAGAFLPTLRSRCLSVNFRPLSRELVAQFLVSEKGMASEEGEFLAALSMGSLGAALEMDGANLRERRNAWSGMLSALKIGDYRGAMQAAETLAASREEALKFAEWACSWYRDLVVCAARRDSSTVVNLDMQSELRRQAPQRSLEELLFSAREASAVAQKIRRNLNRRMVLEQFFFGIVGSG